MSTQQLQDSQVSLRRRYGWLWRSLLLIGGLVVLAIIIWLLVPSPIDAAAWQPPSRPALEGVYAVNQALATAELIAAGEIAGPEDIVFDSQGRLYTGSSDGFIYRITFNGDDYDIEPFANTEGRPLGLRFDAADNLIVADSSRGLLQVSPRGEVTVLTDRVNDTPITYADELDIASDSSIYFSDASSRFERGFPFDMLEARPHGRLLRYTPDTGETEELLSGLYFANGVVLSHDETYLLVIESFRYRIRRLWLTGPRAGESEIFADNLIGIPDNIERGENGSYWVAMNNLRQSLIDNLHPHPFLKEQLAKLGQERLRTIAANNRYGLVVQLGTDGNVITSLHDPDGRLYNLSTAVPHEGYLYLGTLFGNAIGRLPLTVTLE